MLEGINVIQIGVLSLACIKDAFNLYTKRSHLST